MAQKRNRICSLILLFTQSFFAPTHSVWIGWMEKLDTQPGSLICFYLHKAVPDCPLLKTENSWMPTSGHLIYKICFKLAYSLAPALHQSFAYAGLEGVVEGLFLDAADEA